MTSGAVIGVISDTHGLLRPEAVAALRGSALILHAGDIGRADILDRLRTIAPLVAVRGNIDRGYWAESVPATEVVEFAGLQIYMLHDGDSLDLDPAAAGFAAVVCGHSHQPKQEFRRGVLYFNPGSAGPRRFKLPISVGKLHVKGKRLEGELIRLDL